VTGDFRPAWWCRSGHLQTLWGTLFRHRRLALRRERLATDDGDFVDLDWLDGPAAAPVLFVLHGLEGSARSHYVTALLEAARARGWRGLALNFRSCSGELNRLPRFYHSGDTGDLDAVVGRLGEREPGIRLGAVGVSLGGNVLLKWLGEQADRAPAALRGAVGISVPFDLAACARVLESGLPRTLYTANFLRTMRSKVVRKAAAYPGFVDVAGVRRARTFTHYDSLVTAPLHGFADAMDYWVRASSGPYLPRIRRPTLLIGARDDPIVPASALPDPATLPGCVRAEFLPRGGHAGFFDAWRGPSWAERRALAFLAPLLA
jgi:predicted alpha/beta-fold hydrolase